jgi:cytochrome oxidase assembly protein ShyY1
VLTPLDLGDGAAVLVDRGWIPFEADQAVPVTGAAAAPGGVVTVDGYLLPAEDATPPGAAPVRTIQRIDIELLQGQIPERLAPMAVQLASQDPSQASPVPAPLPELDEGPHLSYAIQWFSFATIALVGGAVLLIRDRRRSAPGVAQSTPDGASSAPEGR